MKPLTILSTLILFSLPANATVNYCHPITGNWVNSAPTNCPPIKTPTTGLLNGAVVTPDIPNTPPEQPPVDDPKVKNNRGHGNGDERDCSGSGCHDPDNPGHGPKN